MREWLTAQEIADLRLAGMPTTKRNINEHARREGWAHRDGLARSREGAGSWTEYHVDLLPLPARIDYYRRHLATDPAAERLLAEAAAEPGADLLSADAAERRDAHLVVLGAADAFRREAKLSATAADALFVKLYLAGKIEVPQWARQAIRALSARSLARWRSLRKAGLTKRLGVDKAAARKGKGVLDLAEGGRVKTYILALIVHQPHLTAHHVRSLVRAEFGDAFACGERQVPVPPVRTFQHFLKGLRKAHKVDLVALTNPDMFRSQYRVSSRGSLRHVTRPNQLWQIDASPADVICVDGRHAIYGCIDIATRRVKLYVSKTPRAAAVGLVMRRAVLAWGVPEAVKTDNGSDFIAKESQRLFASLDIELIVATAFSPEQKGHVERVIRTLQHDLMPLMGGYVGHNVAERKAIESRKSFAKRLGEDVRETFAVNVTAVELQRYCDQWAETVYERRAHSGLGGRTPHDVAAAAPEPMRAVDPRALDMLLAPAAGKDGYRTVTKFGVRVNGLDYRIPSVLPETRVFVRMDPADLGRAFVFDGTTGAFLGEAVCNEATGIDPVEAAEAARAEQKRIIDERTAEARREAKRIAKGPALIDLVLDVAKRDAGNVVGFPKRQVGHTTPELAAAAEAARRPIHEPAGLTGRAAEIFAEMQREAAAPPESANVRPMRPIAPDLDTPQRRFRRALALEALAAHEIGTNEANWLRGYQEGAEYRAMRGLYEDFGEKALAD